MIAPDPYRAFSGKAVLDNLKRYHLAFATVRTELGRVVSLYAGKHLRTTRHSFAP